MKETIDFQTFWDAYALKRDRIAAERAWRKLSAKDKKAALDGIAPYRDDCQRRGIQRMYAQGYLNHRRWEDERDTEPVSAPASMQGAASRIDTPDAQALAKMEKW